MAGVSHSLPCTCPRLGRWRRGGALQPGVLAPTVLRFRPLLAMWGPGRSPRCRTAVCPQSGRPHPDTPVTLTLTLTTAGFGLCWLCGGQAGAHSVGRLCAPSPGGPHPDTPHTLTPPSLQQVTAGLCPSDKLLEGLLPAILRRPAGPSWLGRGLGKPHTQGGRRGRGWTTSFPTFMLTLESRTLPPPPRPGPWGSSAQCGCGGGEPVPAGPPLHLWPLPPPHGMGRDPVLRARQPQWYRGTGLPTPHWGERLGPLHTAAPQPAHCRRMDQGLRWGPREQPLPPSPGATPGKAPGSPEGGEGPQSGAGPRPKCPLPGPKQLPGPRGAIHNPVLRCPLLPTATGRDDRALLPGGGPPT